ARLAAAVDWPRSVAGDLLAVGDSAVRVMPALAADSPGSLVDDPLVVADSAVRATLAAGDLAPASAGSAAASPRPVVRARLAAGDSPGRVDRWPPSDREFFDRASADSSG